MNVKLWSKTVSVEPLLHPGVIVASSVDDPKQKSSSHAHVGLKSCLFSRFGTLLVIQPPSPTKVSINHSLLKTTERKRTSPARNIETPQILPSNPTPSYVAPCMDFALVDRMLRHSTPSTSPDHGSPEQDKPEGKRAHRRCFDRLWNDGQVIEPLLNKQPNDPIRIEQKIPSSRIFITDDRVECIQLGRLLQSENGGR
jgi:hypothetical protein